MTEKAYGTTQRECLAILWPVLLPLAFHYECGDYAFGRVIRTRLREFQINIDVVHRSGIELQAADAMSRCLIDAINRTPLEDVLSVININIIQND